MAPSVTPLLLLLGLAKLVSPASSSNSYLCSSLLLPDNGNISISAQPNSYLANTSYQVTVSWTQDLQVVILLALDASNASVGVWQGVNLDCNGSLLMTINGSASTSLFNASWTSPNILDIQTVQLRAVGINLDNSTSISSLYLTDNSTTTASATATIPTVTSLGTTRNAAFVALTSPGLVALQFLLAWLTYRLLT